MSDGGRLGAGPAEGRAGPARSSSRARPERPRLRARLALWVGVAIVAVSGIYIVVTTVRLVLVYRDLGEAKASLLATEAALRQEGLDATPATLATAKDEALAACREFRSAERFLKREPLLRLARYVPWLGLQVKAAQALAGIGCQGSEIELAGIAALRTFNAVRAEEQGTTGEKAVTLLLSVEPQVETVEGSLSAIRERRADIDTRWLLPPLSGLVQELDARVARLEDAVETYRHGQRVATEVLGVDGPRSYLLLGLDNTELLPGGGLIGMYGVVTFEKGRVVERSFGEVDELIESWQVRSGGEYVQPPGPLKRYLLRDWTWNFAVSNWSPDFPTSARQALFFYERSGAAPVDGVIALDFAGLEGLLAVLGPMEIEGYGVTVDSDNVTEEILTRIGRPLRPEDGDHAFAGAVATEVVDGALAADREKWPALLDTLGRLAEEKHLFLYVNDGQVQRSVRELGWAGQVEDGPGDYLMAVNASVHSTKLNLVLEERMEVSVHLNGDDSAQNVVTLHYENDLGEWASGRDPELVSRLMLSGFYGGYVWVLVPPGAQLLDLRLNGRTVGAEEIAQEAGKVTFGRYLPLRRDQQADLQFVYEVPVVVEARGDTREYRLFIQKQPGSAAKPLTVAVQLPSGADAKSVLLNGVELPGEPLEVNTDLSVDRELVVRYEL